MTRFLPCVVLCCLLHASVTAGTPDGADSTGSPPESTWQIWAGPCAGYSAVLMTDPNKLLKETEEDLRRLGGPSADLLDGGLLIGGHVTAGLDRLLLGVDVARLGAIGSYELSYNIEDLKEKITADIWLLFATVGYRATLKSDYILDLMIAGGYGIGSAKYELDYTNPLAPASNRTVRGDFDGRKFVFMPQAVLRVPVGILQLDFRGAYRFANLGVMKGPVSVNGQDIGEDNLMLEQRDVEFDYSGFVLTGGISIRLY